MPRPGRGPRQPLCDESSLAPDRRRAHPAARRGVRHRTTRSEHRHAYTRCLTPALSVRPARTDPRTPRGGGTIRSRLRGAFVRVSDTSSKRPGNQRCQTPSANSAPQSDVGTLLRMTCGSKSRQRLIASARGPRRRRRPVSIRSGSTTFTAAFGSAVCLRISVRIESPSRPSSGASSTGMPSSSSLQSRSPKCRPRSSRDARQALRVLDRVAGPRVGLAGEHAQQEAVRHAPFGALLGGDRGHVGDDDVRLGQQPDLEPELGALRGREQRALAELLRENDRDDDVVVTVAEAPDLVQHDGRRVAARRLDVEPRLPTGEVEPARVDAGVGALARNVHRAEACRRRPCGRTRPPPRPPRRAPPRRPARGSPRRER